MKRWIGLIASWALLVLGVGLLAWAVAAETLNVHEAAKYRRYDRIEEMIQEMRQQRLDELREKMEMAAGRLDELSGEVESSDETITDHQDSNQVITVSTEENKVYMRRDGEVVFEAVCSTGKSGTLVQNGRRRDFRTPVGRFKVISKETAPVWKPPDWHYLEIANSTGASMVRLDRDSAIGTPEHMLSVSGKDVVEIRNGQVVRTMPAGEEIWFQGRLVVPPIGTRPREYDGVLGDFRLNLGDGYALHGTQAVSQLGQSVSHGCIRLSNEDIGRLYRMANVGDEVIIY